jgi:cysteine desulfurase
MVYFDNASATQATSEVINVMNDVLKSGFSEPVRIHKFGRKAKVILENARSSIANHFNCFPEQIFFTSGGSEANYLMLYDVIFNQGIKRIITTQLEHSSILDPLQFFVSKKLVQIDYIKNNKKGHIDTKHLHELLKNSQNTLVTLTHANHAISNLLSIKHVCKLCKSHNALFHSDMAQTAGKYKIDLRTIDPDFITASARKFHGPQGAGFLYVKSGKLEQNFSWLENNITALAGMEKALQISIQNIENDKDWISSLRKYMVQQLRNNFQDIEFIGDSYGKGHYTILSVLFSQTHFSDMLVENLDIEGIAISNVDSRILHALGLDENCRAVRFSFSKYNTCEEIDFCVDQLKKIQQ